MPRIFAILFFFHSFVELVTVPLKQAQKKKAEKKAKKTLTLALSLVPLLSLWIRRVWLRGHAGAG